MTSYQCHEGVFAGVRWYSRQAGILLLKYSLWNFPVNPTATKGF